MNHTTKFLAVATITALGIATASNASSVTIDFESFIDQQDIEGVDLGGVTITNPDGPVEIFDDRFGVGSNSGTKAIGSFFGIQSNNPMVFTFASAVSFVEIFAGDAGGDNDSFRIDLYDAAIGGTLLGSVSSGVFSGNPYQALSFSGAGIQRMEAFWTGTSAGIGYDDLTFRTAVVPLPASGLLLAAALGGLALRSRMTKVRHET